MDGIQLLFSQFSSRRTQAENRCGGNMVTATALLETGICLLCSIFFVFLLLDAWSRGVNVNLMSNEEDGLQNGKPVWFIKPPCFRSKMLTLNYSSAWRGARATWRATRIMSGEFLSKQPRSHGPLNPQHYSTTVTPMEAHPGPSWMTAVSTVLDSFENILNRLVHIYFIFTPI